MNSNNICLTMLYVDDILVISHWFVALCREERFSIVRREEGRSYCKPNENLIVKPRACGAAVAQGTHNPLVVGSNPSGPIF